MQRKKLDRGLFDGKYLTVAVYGEDFKCTEKSVRRAIP